MEARMTLEREKIHNDFVQYDAKTMALISNLHSANVLYVCFFFIISFDED